MGYRQRQSRRNLVSYVVRDAAIDFADAVHRAVHRVRPMTIRDVKVGDLLREQLARV